MQRASRVTLALVTILLLFVTVVAGLAAPSGTSALTLTSLERQVITSVNAQRVAHGQAPVRAHSSLMAAARAQSRDMAHNSFFSHYSLSGASFGSRLVSYGYRRDGYSAWSVGENIASARAGTLAATPQGVVILWMQNAAHRRVVLGAAFRDVGVGVHLAGGRRYFTLDLGYRRP
ncbi:MAG TPA: CAP domain-containing protein [Thermoleophilia bacterium]